MERRPNEPQFMKVPPFPVHEFRKVEPSDNYCMPEVSKNRRCTDLLFFLLFFVNIFALIVFSFVFAWNRTLIKSLKGNDACGNVCGVKNIQVANVSGGCKAEDYTNYTVFFYSKKGNKCIRKEDCKGPELKLVYRRCFSKAIKHLRSERFCYELLQNIFDSRYSVLVMMCTALVLCLLMYIAHYKNSHITCLTLTFAGIFLATVISVTCWFQYFKNHNEVDIIPSVLSLIYLAAVVIVLIFLSDSFSLVARLYAEAIQIISKSPVLLIQPFISVMFVFIMDGVIIYAVLILQFCMNNGRIGELNYYTWYLVYMFLVVCWFHGMASGCQCMIVGGVTSAHFFTREEPPHWPYLKSVWITIKYHLGTVAAGSCVITILHIVKPIASCVEKNKCCFVMFNHCCDLLNEYASYLTKWAYIMTAIHGRCLHPSGRRIARLRWLFMCDIIAIDDLACVCMHMASFLFTLCGLFILITMNSQLRLEHDITLVFLALFFTGTITFFCVSLMNDVIDALVVCFCEDRFMNSESRFNPYFMSPNLHSLMIDALQLAYKETRTRNNL